MVMKVKEIFGILGLTFITSSLGLWAQQPTITIPFQYNNGTFDTVHGFYGNDPRLGSPIQLFYTHALLGLPQKEGAPGLAGLYFTSLKLKPDMKFHFFDLDLGFALIPGYVLYQLGGTYESHFPMNIRSIKRYGPVEVVAQAGGPNGAVFSGEAVRMPFTTQKVRAMYWGLKRESLSLAKGLVYHSALLGMSWSRYSTTSTFQVAAAKTNRSADFVRFKTALNLPIFSYGPSVPSTTKVSPFIGANVEFSNHITVDVLNPYYPALRRLEQQVFMSFGVTMHPFLINNRPVFTFDLGGGAKLWSIGLHRFGRESVKLGDSLYRKKVRSFNNSF
jgi:hypothetical protein